MAATFFTVGHSTRTLAELLALLEESGVDVLVDVRAFPGSRRYPHFNKESLSVALPAAGRRYVHLPALGGRRRALEGAAVSPNDYWQNASFRRYADYALTPAFHDGLTELEALGEEGACALLCSEAVWWRCHRRIIADYLLARKHEVKHILGPRQVEPATLTQGARLLPGPQIHYEAQQASLL